MVSRSLNFHAFLRDCCCNCYLVTPVMIRFAEASRLPKAIRAHGYSWHMMKDTNIAILGNCCVYPQWLRVIIDVIIDVYLWSMSMYLSSKISQAQRYSRILMFWSELHGRAYVKSIKRSWQDFPAKWLRDTINFFKGKNYNVANRVYRESRIWIRDWSFAAYF